MNKNQEIFTQLNAITQASNKEKHRLIDAFKKNHPDETHWLDMLETQPQNTSLDGFIPAISDYEIIKTIGSGANGTVYLAKNKNKQQVAIKTPNVWLTDEQIARFKHEGQLLAKLNHPNIAQVLAVGEFAAAQGHMPFIVLEYIEGQNIDQYVSSNQLEAKQIVSLFKSVLSAVQFAHQKQVIHRDIKPENIIVNHQGVPKLLDFGIATLAADATMAMTQLTKTGEIVGTLAYMSPEQVSGSDDIDSRTDVYSCGVLLYELISGNLPYSVDASQFFSAINKILHETPKNITQFNANIDDSLAAVIHHAIEKQPGKRFQTAHDFNKDLDAWLNNEPIQSQQLSKWYWLKQAAKNNKALVTGTALAFLGLVTGLVFAIAFALKEQQARTLADQQAEANRQVVQFINDLFVNADPSESLGENITVKQVLESAQYSIDNNLANDATVEAQIRLVLGNAFDAIEMYPSAIAQYNQGISRLNKQDELYFELVTQRLSSLTSNTEFETLMSDASRIKNELAESSIESSKKQFFINKITFEEAMYYTANGKMHEALELIEKLQQEKGLDIKQKFAVNRYRSHIHRQMGEVEQAEKLFRAGLDNAKATFGSTHPITLGLLQELTLTLQETNKIDEALELYDVLIEGVELNYGENSTSAFLAKMNKATTYMYAGDFVKADEMTVDLLPLMIKHIGSMHQYTLTMRNVRAGILENLGQLDEALVMYHEALDLFLQSESKDNFTTLIIPHNIAIVYNKQGETQQANQVYETYRPKCEEMLTLEHPLCIIMADSHADILIQIGDYSKASELLAYSNPALNEKYGPDHFRVIASNNRLKKLKNLNPEN